VPASFAVIDQRMGLVDMACKELFFPHGLANTLQTHNHESFSPSLYSSSILITNHDPNAINPPI
jgi:hypothetical protein